MLLPQAPKFWINPPERPGVLARALSPLAFLYGRVVQSRWAKAPLQRGSVPVICVGNINLGGTGKTPTVIDLVMRLSTMGHSPHVVSRGYGGSLTGPVLVNERMHTANDVGDEPILLSGFAPTWVSKDRYAGVIAATNAGADVVVLDDGMQNGSVAKDLTLVVVDAGVGFGNARVLPAGPLREPLAGGLAKANFVVVIGTPEDATAFSETWSDQIPCSVLTGALEVLPTGMDWQGLRALAFAGIGRPQKFFDTLADAGAVIVKTRSFADHQEIPTQMLTRLDAEARHLNAQLVTTEKDAARLPKAWQQKVLTLPVRLKIDQDAGLEQALVGLFRDD